jgi:hypothetical protein
MRAEVPEAEARAVAAGEAVVGVGVDEAVVVAE